MARVSRWVFLADEATTIGSGYRKVTAVVGYKWVRLRSATSPVPQNFSRLTREVWDRIVEGTDARRARFDAACAFYERNGRYPGQKKGVTV